MAYTLTPWVDEPSVATPVSAANLLLANTAITDLDTRATAGPPVGYGYAGAWGNRVYGDLMSNMNRDDADDIYQMTSTTRTQLFLLGQSPAGTYAAFRLYVTAAITGGTVNAALFSATNRTDTSWARLGAGNVTPVLTGTGVVSTSLAFTLASDQWVLLMLALTGTAPSVYPTFAAGAVVTASAFINPASGAPVSATANLTAAPGATLNPTTGYTGLAQKIWCALA